MKGNNPDFPLHSISEINKRTQQLAVISVSLGFFISLIYTSLGLYRTAAMVVGYCGFISLILLLNHKNIIKNTKLPLIAFASLALIIFAGNEGYGTGQYLYYFPIIVAIPIIVDNQKTYFNKIVLYFSITGVASITCVVIGVMHQPWDIISEHNRSIIFYINAVTSLLATISFSYINVNLERKYLKHLIEQKNHTIDSRTQFLSTMGHELRTPLNGIIGAINLLKKLESLPEQQEYFNILKYCSDQMLFQVNDILDYNKIEAGKLEIHPVEINLKQLLVNAVMPFVNLFEEKGLKLILDIDPELNKLLLVDDVRLIQILNNLLSNAGKFTNAGFIKLSAKTINQNTTKQQVRFSVEDTGTGIALQDQERVFDTFGQVFDANTRKITGSGLGLTICNQILELMDSKMQLTSEKGVGSIFSFEINFELPAIVTVEAVLPVNPNADLEGIKILVVEDNQINMLIAKKMLNAFKANCVKAYNGEEALALLEENTEPFHIILMDLEMPVMDGYTAIKKMKSTWPHLPVLAFTATMMDKKMMEDLQSIGFEDCIMKPFQGPALLKQIQKYALVPNLDLH